MLARFKQRATLLSQTLVPDGGGGYSESWQTAGYAWVAITPLGASDKAIADTSQTRVRHRIQTRTRADIVAGMRLATADRQFAIRAVLAAEAQSPWLTLLCEELP